MKNGTDLMCAVWERNWGRHVRLVWSLGSLCSLSSLSPAFESLLPTRQAFAPLLSEGVPVPPLRFGDWEHPEHAAVDHGLANLQHVWEVPLKREL